METWGTLKLSRKKKKAIEGTRSSRRRNRWWLKTLFNINVGTYALWKEKTMATSAPISLEKAEAAYMQWKYGIAP